LNTARPSAIRRLLDLDERWSRALRVAEQPGLLRTLAAVFAHSGDSWFWLAGLGLLFVLGPAGWRLAEAEAAAALIFGAAIVLAIKFIVRRRRPEGEWGAIYRATDPHSFPSGHAARAVLLAVLAFGLGPGWLALLLAVWAPLVILARVAMGVHYLSDVLAGAGLGLLLGWIALAVIP
jgi:undecaprenyl-diphosphatase